MQRLPNICDVTVVTFHIWIRVWIKMIVAKFKFLNMDIKLVRIIREFFENIFFKETIIDFF